MLLIITGAITAALAASRLIDYLYKTDSSDLSFPNELDVRSRFRLPLLVLGFAAILHRPQDSLPAAVLSFIFLSALLISCITDWEQYVIFDRVLLSAAAAGLLRLAAGQLNPQLLNTARIPACTDALLAGAAGFGIFLLFALLTRGALGGGDIKLVGLEGLWLGTSGLCSALLVGLLLGGIAALLLLLTGRKKRGDYFAYGPYLAIGAAWIFLLS